MRSALFALTLFANQAAAVEPDLQAITTSYILPGYAALAETTASLAALPCDDRSLPAAYHTAFDAWTRVSHLRFGPSETGDRAFALAFWPDPRGKTPKVLFGLTKAKDRAAIEATSDISIAARGFYALEFLLFDDAFTTPSAYRCALIEAVTQDLSANASAIHADWTHDFAAQFTTAENETYQTQKEAVQQLYTALLAGLEFTAAIRLGQPLGSFEQPRPNRAEARRSGRSLRHVVLSLQATRALSLALSGGDAALDQSFAKALEQANALDEPVFAGVSDPRTRIRVEALQQAIDGLHRSVQSRLGPQLGLTAGFNALDGD